MYRLYVNAPQSSWSLRIWLLLKELDIPFETQKVSYLDNPSEQRRQFLTFSPTAKIPVLYHGDTVVWDSLAITEYLAERHPHIWPEDGAARIWSRCACAEMHSGFEHLRTVCSYNPLAHTPLDSVSDELSAELARINALWTQGLAAFGGDYLAGGRFSAADAFFAPVAGRVETYGLHRYFSESALAYQQRIMQSPNMRLWLAADV